METYTHVAKVVLVGNSGVGKTSLAQRLAGEDFATDLHLATIGVDFKARVQKIDKECTLKTLFWDTAGQERYRSIAHNFFRGANAVIVVYDVTDADSLIDVDKWIRDMEDATGGSRLIRMLLGNKTDSHRKIVDSETAARFASERGFDLFLEVSAKSGANVDQALSALSDGIVASAAHSSSEEEEKERRRLREEERMESNSCCVIA